MIALIAFVVALMAGPSYGQLTPSERDVIQVVAVFERARLQEATMPLQDMDLALFRNSQATCLKVGSANTVVIQLDLDGLTRANQEQGSLRVIRGGGRGPIRRISRPAFSSDSLHAIVMVAGSTEKYPIESHFVALDNVRGVWRVVVTCLGWETVS